MSEERKCYNCEGRKVVPEGEGGPYVTVCPQCGGTDKSDTIQSLAAQLAEARDVIEAKDKALQSVFDWWTASNIAAMPSPWRDWDAALKLAPALTSSSALARYKAMEAVAKAAKGLFAGLDWSWETRVTWDRLGPLHEALHQLQEVPHDPTD
jgi:hypothetical protein